MLNGAMTSTVLDKTDSENVAIAAIGQNNTQSFFGNELFISVESFSSWESKISFAIGAPGYSNQLVTDAQNGKSIIYQTNIKYDVRVTSIKTFPLHNADFTVTRLAK